jgi:acyl dehydratase
MISQVFYEDINEGTEIPALTKHPTTRQLVMWAGGSGDFYEIHYDKDFARSQGLEGVIVHGRLKLAFMGQLVTDWIGTEGVLKKLTCQYRGMDVPGQDMTVKGKVTNKYVKDGQHWVELDISTENPTGEKTTLGTAAVVLPSRG